MVRLSCCSPGKTLAKGAAIGDSGSGMGFGVVADENNLGLPVNLFRLRKCDGKERP
jgi:hypothetical protein